MKLFFYYAAHTFKNQLKKMFKTWVIVFILACMLLGGLIGFGASKLSDASEELHSQAAEEEIVEQLPFQEEDSSFSGEIFRSGGVLELVIGGVILLLFTINALSADKNGSAIFLPADVNLLFASPMKPQSVLMFRLMTQIGALLFSGVYLLFQLPNLIHNMGLSLWAALCIIAAFWMTTIFSKLLQVMLYTFGSSHPAFMKRMRYIIYGVLGAIAAGFLLFWQTSGAPPLEAAQRFFNARATRLIPVWGWLKGFCMYAAEGNAWGAVLSLLALLAGGGLLIFFIWRIRADFYEDAMAKSEETAALLREAQENRVGFARRKGKDRSEKLTRDGMTRGWGANVFFFKSLYNRFRFAHFHIFTKTSETYLFAAVAVSVFLRFWLDKPNLTVVACVLGGLAFFRSLGNPLSQDTKMDYFILIPESAWKKMLWSLLGGTVNCLLDLLPAMIAAVVLLGANPLIALAWMVFIASVDFYSTNVGVFLDISLPSVTVKTVKQLVQIFFLYFGLLPDIAILAVAMVFDKTALGVVGATAINLILGLIFFAFAPSFLEPKVGRPARARSAAQPESAALPPEEISLAKRRFSRMGAAVLAIWILWVGLTIACYPLMDRLLPGWTDNALLYFLYSDIPLYLVGIPVGLLILKRVPAQIPQRHTLPLSRFFMYFAVCQFMMYAGNLVGMGVSRLVEGVFGIAPVNPLNSLFENSSVWVRLLFAGILAPLVEEFLFRKQLIDRMRPYGERTAVLLSALMFGLFHGNLSQLFYAFSVGLVLGYLYLRSGKLRYTVVLHMIANILGGVIGPLLLEKLNAGNFSEMTLEELASLEESISLGSAGWFVGYAFLVFGIAVAGLVILCLKHNKVVFLPAEKQLAKKQSLSVTLGNPGMLLLFLFAVGMIVRSVLLSA